MNTERSDVIVDRYRDRSWRVARKSFAWTKVVHGSRGEVFPLLCPSREADWIPGWKAELVYTESGYAEKDCVFRTAPGGTAAPGVWVFTRHDEGEGVELVKFTADVLGSLYIALEADGPDRTRVRWEWTLTALTSAGNIEIEGADASMAAQLQSLAPALNHYLEKGELIPIEATRSNEHAARASGGSDS